jgi:predicted RNase H-like HicB family nuclease
VKQEFTVVIEKDEDGYFVGTVPQLKGCHTQAKSLDELIKRVQEAALLCLEIEGDMGEKELQFVGVQRITV